ncbi:uncharacterized protein PGTG_05582 [Puccinia graminis f. sp. tritici CRL 75-36-700-3]|uniref:Uncharacterized protein n=1 Tax=Puccinia graminis f. sp. tritici (strain CRL 75-36-700-3 / race SCCL) TaxID=418459 RepID=E3K4U6_PUCGT|nr:uncharacterized protein PGTG_05582 [Puccinia graminis f. sp. tritici CRL 75-36-700-3]EFP79261.2 hypothetical protein PGTG_05582 [Puccinia graminis f. sp. tritici CRL 75-36-700-3]
MEKKAVRDDDTSLGDDLNRKKVLEETWMTAEGDESAKSLPGRSSFIGVAVEDPVGHKAHQPLYFVSGRPERW